MRCRMRCGAIWRCGGPIKKPEPTPPEPTPSEFTPNNSILVQPTRGNAILKFFATDENSEDYVYARLGANNKLTYVSFYGACEGEPYCEELFSNETIKEELGASIGNYIDEYGIPETGLMTFSESMFSVIESYYAGTASVEDVVAEIETGDVVEPVEPEPDPCDEDPCSDPNCPNYDPCECEGDCHVTVIWDSPFPENTLQAGKTSSPYFKFEPASAADNALNDITFDWGDSSIISVDDVHVGDDFFHWTDVVRFNVTGVSEGQTAITYSLGNTTYSMNFTITPAPSVDQYINSFVKEGKYIYFFAEETTDPCVRARPYEDRWSSAHAMNGFEDTARFTSFLTHDSGLATILFSLENGVYQFTDEFYSAIQQYLNNQDYEELEEVINQLCDGYGPCVVALPEPDPCDEDPCSDPNCPNYDPCECGGPCIWFDSGDTTVNIGEYGNLYFAYQNQSGGFWVEAEDTNIVNITSSGTAQVFHVNYRGMNAGTTNIIAHMGEATCTVEVTVTEPTPETCSVIITDVDATIQLDEGEENTFTYMTSYDCPNPDYSNIYIDSDEPNTASVELDAENDSFTVWGNSRGLCTLTLADGENLYYINVEVGGVCDSSVCEIEDIEQIYLEPEAEMFPIAFQTCCPSSEYEDFSNWQISVDDSDIAYTNFDTENHCVEVWASGNDGETTLHIFDGVNDYSYPIVATGYSSTGVTRIALTDCTDDCDGGCEPMCQYSEFDNIYTVQPGRTTTAEFSDEGSPDPIYRTEFSNSIAFLDEYGNEISPNDLDLSSFTTNITLAEEGYQGNATLEFEPGADEAAYIIGDFEGPWADVTITDESGETTYCTINYPAAEDLPMADVWFGYGNDDPEYGEPIREGELTLAHDEWDREEAISGSIKIYFKPDFLYPDTSLMFTSVNGLDYSDIHYNPAEGEEDPSIQGHMYFETYLDSVDGFDSDVIEVRNSYNGGEYRDENTGERLPTEPMATINVTFDKGDRQPDNDDPGRGDVIDDPENPYDWAD